MLGQTDDGNWVHIRSDAQGRLRYRRRRSRGCAARTRTRQRRAGRRGGGRAAGQEARRAARAWVSKSRYHEGEEVKLIVSVNKAKLYGRPSSTGAVIGILRRGEAVQLVKKSADKKWMNIDIGGGETAWILAQVGQAGQGRRVDAAARGSRPRRRRRRRRRSRPRARRRRRSWPRPRAAAAARGEGRRAASPAARRRARSRRRSRRRRRPKSRRRRRRRGATPRTRRRRGWRRRRATATKAPAPTEEKPSKKKRKLKKLASRTEEARRRIGGREIVKDNWTSRGKIYLSPARARGHRHLEPALHVERHGPLVELRRRRPTRSARSSGSASTAPSASTSSSAATPATRSSAPPAIRYILPTDGSAVTLAVQAHTIDGGLSAGVHFLGGGGGGSWAFSSGGGGGSALAACFTSSSRPRA